MKGKNKETYWDTFLKEFEMSDLARYAIKKDMNKTTTRALLEERKWILKMIADLKKRGVKPDHILNEIEADLVFYNLQSVRELYEEKPPQE